MVILTIKVCVFQIVRGATTIKAVRFLKEFISGQNMENFYLMISEVAVHVFWNACPNIREKTPMMESLF